jgi:putative membrane protein
MAVLSSAATTLLALLHVYIMVLEMFLWTTPRGRKSFRLTAEFAQQTKSLAANQGLYNGFLAAGLLWGLLHPVPEFAVQIRLFFCLTVVVAGLYGGATAARKIWVVQMLPGIVSLALVYLDV